MFSVLVDCFSFVAVVAAFFLAVYICCLVYSYFFAYTWERIIVPFYYDHESKFKKLGWWSLVIGLLLLAAVDCKAQEESDDKESIKRWKERMENVDKEWQKADKEKAEGTYKAPVKEKVKSKKWLPKDQWLAKKKFDDSVALAKKLLKMSDSEFNVFEDSLVDYRMKKLEDWKKKQGGDYQYKKFKKDSLWQVKKDSTSNYWADKKDERYWNNVKWQEKKDSSNAFWDAKKVDNKRMKEAYEEAKAADNKKWEKINKEKADKKKAEEQAAEKKGQLLDRQTGRNRYLSDEQYNKEKEKKKKN